MVKMLAITPMYLPEVGGGALASHLIIDLLAKANNLTITVLTRVQNPEKVKGVSYYYDPFLRLVNKRYIPPSCLTKRYQKIIEKHDVVYIAYAFPLIPVAKKFGKKTIVHLHDYRPISPSATILAGSESLSSFELLKEDFIVNLLQKRGLKHLHRNMLNVAYTMLIRQWVSMADCILAVSKRHAKLISKYMPECRSKIRVQYNPLPPVPNIKKNLDSTPTFLYVGGDSYVKGFHILLQSMKQTVKENTPVKFILANHYGKNALRAVGKLNRLYGEKIKVVGKISREQLLKIHERAWALLFPSICEEPLPYAVLESMTVGTLPIASNVGGVPEIVEGTCAERFLFSPLMPKKLLEHIHASMDCSSKFWQKSLLPELLNDFKRNQYKYGELDLLKYFY